MSKSGDWPPAAQLVGFFVGAPVDFNVRRHSPFGVYAAAGAGGLAVLKWASRRKPRGSWAIARLLSGQARV
jgi:hypothetical protein